MTLVEQLEMEMSHDGGAGIGDTRGRGEDGRCRETRGGGDIVSDEETIFSCENITFFISSTLNASGGGQTTSPTSIQTTVTLPRSTAFWATRLCAEQLRRRHFGMLGSVCSSSRAEVFELLASLCRATVS